MTSIKKSDLVGGEGSRMLLPRKSHTFFLPCIVLGFISSFSCSIDNTIRGYIGLPQGSDLLNSTISFSGLAIADNASQVEVRVLLKTSNGSSIVGSHLNLEIESGDGVNLLVPCPDSDSNGRSLCVIAASAPGTKIIRVSSLSPPVMLRNSVDFVPLLTVGPVYLANKDWNTYVKDGGPGLDEYSQSDVPCDGSETGPYTCIHGGEKRKVSVTGHSSCLDLNLVELLGVFDWECKVKLGVATFFTKALRSSQGLKNLISASAWKTNSVSVYKGTKLVGQSLPTVWDWTNTIEPLPANGGGVYITLDGTDDDGVGPDSVYSMGTIFTLSSSRMTAGYRFGLDGMAIVTLPNAELSWDGSSTANCGAYICMIWNSGTEPDRLWIEGELNGYHANQSARQLIRPWGASMSQVKSTVLRNGTGEGTYFRYGAVNRIRDLVALGLGGSIASGNWGSATNVNVLSGTGVGIAAGSNSYFYNVRVHNNSSIGMTVGDGATAQKVVLSNNHNVGLQLDGLNGTAVGVLTHNNAAAGINFRSGGESRSTVTHVTSINNVWAFNIRSDGDYMTLANGVILNEGIDLDGIGNKFSNLAFSGSLTTYATTVDNSFHQNLLVASGTQCASSLGSNQGLTSGTCEAMGASTHVVRAGLVLTASMNSKLSVDDPMNTSDTLGVAVYSNELDWLNFLNPLRGWGRDGLVSFPDPSHQGSCSGSSPNCVIWDFSLKTADGVLKNTSGAGNSSLENQTFIQGQTCPTAAHGNRAISDSQQRDYYPHINAFEDNLAAGGNDDGICESGEKCYNRFLVNAIEIYGDRVGDEDGLCENGESCVYSPNFGVDQGLGDVDLSGTCVFQNGLVQDVLLYGRI